MTLAFLFAIIWHMPEEVKINVLADRRDILFPVSLAAFEFLIESLANLQDVNEVSIAEVYSTAMTNYCNQESANQEGLNYISDRLSEANKAAGELKGGEDKGKAVKRGFSTEFDKFMRGLPMDTLILQMCGYDFDKAKHIYFKVDRDVALAIVGSYIERSKQDNLIKFEASVYGFGGSFEGGSKEADHQFDVSDGSKSADALLKSMF